MALSGSQIVRVGAGGQPRPNLGSFAGKTPAPIPAPVAREIDVFAPTAEELARQQRIARQQREREERERRDRETIAQELRRLYEGVREEVVQAPESDAADAVAEATTLFASTKAADIPLPGEIDWLSIVDAGQDTVRQLRAALDMVDRRLREQRRNADDEEAVAILLLMG